MNVRAVKGRVNSMKLLTRIIILTCCAKVCSSDAGELCAQDTSSLITRTGDNNGDIFSNTADSCSSACSVSNSNWFSTDECLCRCSWEHTFWSDKNECSETRREGCKFRIKDFTLKKAATIQNLSTSVLEFEQNGWNILDIQGWRLSCSVKNQEYLENDGQWRNLDGDGTFSFNAVSKIQWSRSGSNNDKALDGLLVKLTISCRRGPVGDSCLLFKINGTHTYDPTTSPGCQDEDTTTEESTNSLPMKNRSPTAAIAGGTAAAVIIFIIAGVALFILWRRKFSPRNVGKPKKDQRVTMSSLQNGHPHPTEGTVDNVIYAGDNAGIVDNLIYEGGMGADGVFSNPGYADKTPQFKPRMDVPGAFVQPNPGATNKTPQPQRNVIIEEPQYAQIVDDQYADPQKVRDKKNKKKAAKDKNYADLHGPQPGANNSNSNHVYQGLNKGTDYQSLRGPREHHEVRPSQVPKTPQDGHDYASLAPGGSKPSVGTLSKEGPDYTVLEGPDSPGEETAAGPDYTTLDGPDSPGDEITSGPDYTVLDGPDSPGD